MLHRAWLQRMNHTPSESVHSTDDLFANMVGRSMQNRDFAKLLILSVEIGEKIITLDSLKCAEG